MDLSDLTEKNIQNMTDNTYFHDLVKQLKIRRPGTRAILAKNV